MKLKRSISPLGLLFASVSAVIGSGWLFSAFFTAQIAGPAALLSWVIGGVFIIIVAYVFAELCAMLPISGSSARIPHYTHGTMVSFIFAWMIWLSYLALMATETQAVVQYMSFYFPQLTYASGKLTEEGYIAATVIMFLVAAINIYSLRWLIRFNTGLTLLKIIIPLIVIGVVLYHFFDWHRVMHPNDSVFMPLGMHGIFSALSTGGILFAFNGFKQGAEMAGEAKNPRTAVPFAIVGSVILCLFIYFLLQLTFNVSLTPENLVHGWQHIVLKNNNSPIASILQQDQLAGLLPVLYIGAILAPLAAGLMYCSTAGRSLAGMSKNGYLPKFFQHITAQGNPHLAILINFCVGMCLFAPLPGWDKMVSFLTSLLAITYAVGPICLLTLRKQIPDQNRPLRLPFAKIWATLAFYICTLLAYWSGWDTLSKLGIALAVGWVVLWLYCVFSRKKTLEFNWRASIWIWPYFIGLSLVSYLGNFGGGIGLLSSEMVFAILAVFCVVMMMLAVKFCLPSAKTAEYVKHLELDH